MNSQPRLEEFESVALPHMNDLVRTATRVVRDRTEANDLVQETYLQAWKSFHRFEPGTNCRAWLYKIMFHVIHHHRRKQYRMNLRLVREDEQTLEETLPYVPPVRETLDDEDVVAAFDKLPAHYRDVVLLVDVQELTYKEAADALNVPIGTVMSRVSRGRQVLRAELSDFAKGYGITERKTSARPA
ncbi:MAG TPA: sigma-70 family RNA polymerase sigma factor [Blastocatellia bacterium]|nr:sigma-70 family RNA polymerase sigma factor [Blastocatellia bacterium]